MKYPPISDFREPLTVTQASFNGGMRDRDHPSQLSDNEYAKGVDIEIRDSGLFKTRRGKTIKTAALGAYPQGAINFSPPGGTQVLVQVNGGRIYTWPYTGTAWTQVDTVQLLNTTDPVDLVILNDRLYIFADSAGSGDNVFSWDGIAATLTDEGNGNTNPPRGNIAVQQAGRICASGVASFSGVTNAVDYTFFSAIFNGQSWNRSTNNQRTPSNGSEAITAIASYRDELILVWTRNTTHTWNVTGSSISGFTHKQLDPNIGCVARKSVCVVGEDVFFLSADKQVRTIKRTIQDIAYGVSMPITYLVPNLMDRINRPNVAKCAGIYFDNYYLLAAPLDQNTSNSGVIVFDMLHQRVTPSGMSPVCVGEWTNMKAAMWVISNANSRQSLYYIDAVNGAAYLMFDGRSDDGTTITPVVNGRGISFGADGYDKTAHSGEIQVIDTVGNLSILYARDDGSFNPLITFSNIGGSSAQLPVTLPFTLGTGGVLQISPFTFYRRGRSRYWQLRFSHAGEKLSLKQYSIRAWVEQMVSR